MSNFWEGLVIVYWDPDDDKDTFYAVNYTLKLESECWYRTIEDLLEHLEKDGSINHISEGYPISCYLCNKEPISEETAKKLYPEYFL